MVTHGINSEEYIFHGISDTGTYAIPVPYTMIHQHKVGSLVFPSVPSSPAQGELPSVPFGELPSVLDGMGHTYTCIPILVTHFSQFQE